MMAALLVAGLVQIASGEGTLKGRLVYDGKAPTPASVTVDKDVAYCGPFDLKDERLVVNSKNGGVKNVVVYIYVSRTGKKPPLTAGAKKRAAEVRIDNEKCRFEPRIITMTTDQALIIGNKDSVAHNSKIDVISQANVSINPIIPAGKDHPHKFNVEERLPIPISCSIHPWMSGYLFWQENVGYVQKVKYDGKATTWKRGEKKVEIVSGKTVDLKEIKSKFAK
jgi:hypothetical protein